MSDQGTDDRTIDERTTETLARRLIDATSSRVAIPPLTAEHPSLTAADAYGIQELVVAERLGRGERIVGWKLGLTSKAMQTQLGVDQPDYGPILSGWRIPSGSSLRMADLIAPRVEAEIAVILDAPLRGPGVARSDVIAAAAGASAAIEVIDSRIADWKITLADTIADLASTARVLVADRVVPLDGIEPRLIGCVMTRDGEVLAAAAGAAALGDPLEAVAWAANTLGALGVTMDAGSIVMTGALHASVPAKPGDSFVAEFDRLGSLSVRFE